MYMYIYMLHYMYMYMYIYVGADLCTIVSMIDRCGTLNKESYSRIVCSKYSYDDKL